MKVEVYIYEDCPWCKKLLDFLRTHDIAYEEKNIANAEFAEELFAKSGQETVPVTIIEGKEPILGFEPETLREQLDL